MISLLMIIICLLLYIIISLLVVHYGLSVIYIMIYLFIVYYYLCVSVHSNLSLMMHGELSVIVYNYFPAYDTL